MLGESHAPVCRSPASWIPWRSTGIHGIPTRSGEGWPAGTAFEESFWIQRVWNQRLHIGTQHRKTMDLLMMILNHRALIWKCLPHFVKFFLVNS